MNLIMKSTATFTRHNISRWCFKLVNYNPKIFVDSDELTMYMKLVVAKFKKLFHHIPLGTKDNNRRPQSVWEVPWPEFESWN